jgi:hypothetical protein
MPLTPEEERDFRDHGLFSYCEGDPWVPPRLAIAERALREDMVELPAQLVAIREFTRREVAGNPAREWAVYNFVERGVLRLPEPPDFRGALVWELTHALIRASADANRREVPTGGAAQTPPAESTICMIPGGFVYRRHKEDLAGKPWGVLNAFVNSATKRLTAADLLKPQSGIWAVDSIATADNVKDAVEDVRAALRKVLSAAKVENSPRDPIPCVDRGPNLAWELRMP